MITVSACVNGFTFEERMFHHVNNELKAYVIYLGGKLNLDDIEHLHSFDFEEINLDHITNPDVMIIIKQL